MSLAIENQTKQIAQIIDDYERLKEEFMKVNLQEVLEKHPEAVGLTALNLIHIMQHNQGAFMFLDGLRKILDEEV